MFGKKDGFKYEVEVKALIREATEGLNQRIFALEMQNNQLIQRSQALEGEIYQLKNGLCNDLARLEKRITDFTDVWHPMMTANINRIKADLEKTIMEAEREDIKKVQEDFESKMVKILDERDNEKLLRNLVGLPEYMGSSVKLSKLVEKINEYYSSGAAAANGNNFSFKFNVPYSNGINILDDNNNIIIEGSVKGMNYDGWSCVEYVVSDGFNTMYNYFKEHCEPNQPDKNNWLNSLIYGYPGSNTINLLVSNGGYIHMTTPSYSYTLDKILKPNNRKKIIEWLKNGKLSHIGTMLE